MNIFFKKLISVLITFFIIIQLPIFSLADDAIEDFEDEDFLETTTLNTYEPNILSKNVVVIDRKTSIVLYEKNAYEKVAMASTTKIMTCLIALERATLTETVTFSQKAASIHGSTLGVTKNAKISMLDLLYGLMLRSRK